MMVHNLKFAAVAAISLLGLSFEATPAAAGGFWENGCCGAVMVQPVPVAPSCSCCCGTANYGLPSYGGYGFGYGVGYPGGYGGGYDAGYYGGHRVGYGPEYYGDQGVGYGPEYYGGYSQ